MQKLSNQSKDISQENIKKVEELFPNCVTETYDQDGNLVRSIDFDILRQDLSDHVVEGPKERYQFNWPGKREAILLANAPTTNTLRPLPEKSVDFEKTKNVYIEGDNLEALKILRETYRGKIKMIYIDPPYNTGNDFVYKDDFKQSTEDYLKSSGSIDEKGNRMEVNGESNGRFHSDWLNMMYPRLVLARDLLTDDGVIFISIDQNESENLKRVCDEVFGEKNFRNQIIVRRRIKSLNLQFADQGLKSFNVGNEFVYVYAKSDKFLFNPIRSKKENTTQKGTWEGFWSNADRPTMRYELLGFTPKTGQWRWQKKLADEAVKNYKVYLEKYSKDLTLEQYWLKTGCKLKFIRRIENGTGKNGGVAYWVGPNDTSLRTSNWNDLEVSQIAKDFDLPFENPKNVNLIKELIKSVPFSGNEPIVLDFFSGSATTAEAVNKFNFEESKNIRYVLVQIPDSLNNLNYQSFNSICDLAEERIRLAGDKLKNENPLTSLNVDTGMRVYKIDSSNMKNVQSTPQNTQISLLEDADSAIKADRTSLDLVTQVMLQLGITLDADIKIGKFAGGGQFYAVNGNDLVCCFDKNISESSIEEMARMQPLNAAFRDDSFASDQDEVNCEQIFKTLSPNTGKNIFVL